MSIERRRERPVVPFNRLPPASFYRGIFVSHALEAVGLVVLAALLGAFA